MKSNNTTHRHQLQVSQAANFVSENTARIGSISACLNEAASDFLDKIGRHHIPADVCNALTTMLSQNDLSSFQLLLRNHPISGAGAARRFAYWELNDALSMLGDAVGTQWPYMTMEKRLKSLDFSDESIEAHKFLMANRDAEPSTVLANAA